MEAGLRVGNATQDIPAFSRELAAALSRFDNLIVLDGSGAPPDQSGQSEYRLVGDIGRTDDQLGVSFRLLFGAQNEVVWSRRYPIPGPALDPTARANIIASVVSTLARTSGVIFSDRFRRMPPPDDMTRGFACIMQCVRYYETPTEALFLASHKCLERTIAGEPRDPNAHAALALLTVDGFLHNYSGAEQTQALARAALLAHDAISLAPHSAQAHLALFMARFFDRRFEDAFVSARRALEANPYSIEIRGRVASAYIIRGQFDEGVPLLQEVAGIVDHGPAWLEFYYFLPAYANGDMDAARRYATRTRTAKTPLGVLARIVMAQQDKDQAEAEKWTAHLRTKFPRFAGDVPGALQRLALAEPIRDKLLADLAAAGALTR